MALEFVLAVVYALVMAGVLWMLWVLWVLEWDLIGTSRGEVLVIVLSMGEVMIDMYRV